MRVKIFTAHQNPYGLEESANAWLKEMSGNIEVVSTKLAASSSTNGFQTLAMVITYRILNER